MLLVIVAVSVVLSAVFAIALLAGGDKLVHFRRGCHFTAPKGVTFTWVGIPTLLATATFRWRTTYQTTVYIRRWSADWNSEHLAVYYGRHLVPDCETPHGVPEHAVYSGWLGHHVWC